MSEERGSYEEDELRKQLREYLILKRDTPRRIRGILLPLCLDHEPVTRDEIKSKLANSGEAKDEGQAGRILSTISRELGMKRHDYLRQAIRYDKSPGEQLRENYRIADRYKNVIEELLEEFSISEGKTET